MNSTWVYTKSGDRPATTTRHREVYLWLRDKEHVEACFSVRVFPVETPSFLRRSYDDNPPVLELAVISFRSKPSSSDLPS
jgi:hypothetical protein